MGIKGGRKQQAAAATALAAAVAAAAERTLCRHHARPFGFTPCCWLAPQRCRGTVHPIHCGRPGGGYAAAAGHAAPSRASGDADVQVGHAAPGMSAEGALGRWAHTRLLQGQRGWLACLGEP